MRIARIMAAGALVAGLALAACGPAEKTAAGPTPATAPTADPNWLEKNSVVSGWVTIAQGLDGSKVTYDPTSITRDPAAGTADVWVQVAYKNPQHYRSEDASAVRDLQYSLERVQFRFRCEARQVTNVERQLMKDATTAAETFQTPPKSEADWRPIDPKGMAAKLEGPACRST
jgi:hypothetical protein